MLLYTEGRGIGNIQDHATCYVFFTFNKEYVFNEVLPIRSSVFSLCLLLAVSLAMDCKERRAPNSSCEEYTQDLLRTRDLLQSPVTAAGFDL